MWFTFRAQAAQRKKRSKTMTAASSILPSSAIQHQLEEILASHFFRTSHRCSQMLRYIVEQFLFDPSVRLKERTIGIAVFTRNPDYDTSNDPIVRVTAGEIRKRLAQYYAEQPEATVLITVPAGSYFPAISAHWPAEDLSGEQKIRALEAEVPHHRTLRDFLIRRGWLVILLFAAALTGTVDVTRHLRTGPVQRFWNPLLTAGQPPIICLGDTTRLLLDRGIDPAVEEAAYGINRNDHLALPDVEALNQVVSLLAPRTGRPDVRNSASTSFADLQRQPAVLIGGRTNQWTMRSMKFLRFQLQQGKVPGIVEVIDSQNPSTPPWQVDFKMPLNQIPKVYAIIARFTDPLTNRPTVVVAGAGAAGTIAGAQCLTSPACLKEISQRAPGGWDNRNIEILLETAMVGGAPGPSRILRVHVW
jgi:hypothetical protein